MVRAGNEDGAGPKDNRGCENKKKPIYRDRRGKIKPKEINANRRIKKNRDGEQKRNEKPAAHIPLHRFGDLRIGHRRFVVGMTPAVAKALAGRHFLHACPVRSSAFYGVFGNELHSTSWTTTGFVFPNLRMHRAGVHSFFGRVLDYLFDNV